MATTYLRGTVVPPRETQPCKSPVSDPRPGAAVGPKCRRCKTSEARCARLAGCCDACTHFADLDAAGEFIERPVGRPRRPRRRAS